MNYSEYVKSYKDFPKEGVIFRDFTPLLLEPLVFKSAVKEMIKHFKDCKITKIIGIESKGFILASAIAYELSLPLALIRKQNLTPGEFDSVSFIKEYGQSIYEMKKGVLNSNDKVLIIYDIMAGSGASKAAIELVEKQNAQVQGLAYVVELLYLKGKEDLRDYNTFSLVQIDET